LKKPVVVSNGPKPHFPDPDVKYGAFRVLPRTDGKYIVVDERLPAGKRIVKVFVQLKAAIFAAQLWHTQGLG